MGRTSIILGGVALVLLAFIVFFERGSVTTTERQERKGRILETFVRDRVTRIEIQRKGVTTVLVRDPAKTDEDILGGGGYRVEKPYAAVADREAVESLIGALEFILPRRSLGEVSEKEAAQFGLDKPRYRVSFQAGRDSEGFSIGSQSGDGTGAYLKAGKLAYVVGKDLVEALDHEPVDYHTKTLHKGVSAYTTDLLRLRDAQGEHAIEKRNESYWLQGPEPVLASQPALVDIVNALDALKASRFVVEKPANLESYGLASPRFFLAVDSRSFDASSNKKNEGKKEHLELRMGTACASHSGESYLRVNDGPVMCATDADLAKLMRPPAELRESRLCVLDDGQIRSVEVRAGKRTLRVEEDGDGHRYRVLEDGKERDKGAVDETALSDWFKSLRGAKAEAFENDPAQSLGTIVATIVFERGKDKPAYEVYVGRTQGERVAVSRGGEKPIAWFGKGVLPLVSTSPVRFRKPKLLDLDANAVTKLKLSGASRPVEVVEKQAERFQLTQPSAAAGVAVERPTIDDIARLVAKLEAVRFVADVPTAEHGLTPPQYAVQVDFGGKQPQSHTVKLGAETEGGRYAQLDFDPAVFVLASALGRALETPVVSRSALAIPLEELGSFELTSAGGKVKVERDGSGAYAVVGPTKDAARGPELARQLATLRASRVVRYGKAEADEGMDKPQLKVEIQPGGAGGKPRTLLFGKPVSAEPSVVYVRRSDLEVAFAVPASVLDDLAKR
jgi:Domain of unknown function (DUF4340)